MKCIYHKHQSSNSYWNNEWWDEDYYLCDTEEEYAQQRKYYEEKHARAKEDYARRGYASYTPDLSKEGEVHAREYYYAHEWTGQNFDAFGFSYKTRAERSSETVYILKPGSIKNESRADNSGCVGWMYGS